MKPIRILLCPDKPNWAFDNIANNIIRFAPDQFQVQKFFIGSALDDDIANLLRLITTQNIDIVHFFWREVAFRMFQPEAILGAADKLGVDFNDVVDIIGTRIFTTSVYDHLFSGGEEFERRANCFFMVDAYSVSSRKLFNIYQSARTIPSPDAIITDGVDLNIFSPRHPKHTGKGKRSVGWVGNSAWGEKLGTDPKGYNRLFKPAMDILEQKNSNIRSHIADRQARHIPFAEMPEYYRGIDLLACTSSIEGTPNPILEAMATGIPVVSTDVGVVPELFGTLQSKYVIRDPTPEKFSNAFSEILNNQDLYQSLSEENLAQIKDWSWSIRVRPWWGFWQSAVRQAQNPRLMKWRENALAQCCAAHILSRSSHSQANRSSHSPLRSLSGLKSRLLNR